MEFDDRIFEEPDNEEELLLQGAMEELMLQDEDESSDELDCDISAEDLGLLALETEDAKQKKPKQKQITDYFQSQK